MNIEKKAEKNRLTVILNGRLDTNSAPQLESEIKDLIGDISELVFDLSALEYISSAGLRVLLGAHKQMMQHGKMIVRNAGPALMEVFDVTGFIDFFTFETSKNS